MVMRKMVDLLLKIDRDYMFVRHRLQPSSFHLQGNFVGLDKNLIFKHHSTSRHDSCDFLGANKLGRKFLIGDFDKQRVPVETLRGKILCLYFQSAITPHFVVPCVLREFYNTLKLTKPDSFEMIYVVNPLPPDADPSLHNAIISTLPWLAVPVDDLDWRSYLMHSYNPSGLRDTVFIDTRDNEIEILSNGGGRHHINSYGPQLFPFTEERRHQLEAQLELLGKETSIQVILGTDSRDYLIDRHSNKVHISSLQNKDVFIYAYSNTTALYESLFVKQLEEIYNKFPNHGFEIVSINLDHNGGNEKYEKLWKDHLTQIPWLHLPLGDEKIWLLRTMMTNVYIRRHKGPILFVKPKGESLLDPYGYQVFKNFGIQAFPFTRKAAAHSVVTRLKELSFMSFVDKARSLGLDFNSLIRNKANGGTEHVSLSTILEGRARGILLLFASLETCSQKRLKSLIDVYLSQDESSSSSFEVIFVSTDKDTQSFDDHFSVMPWFAFKNPLKERECEKLAERTTGVFEFGFSHFLAFGPDQLLLQVGLLTKSFENCEFPFVNDAESTDHVAFCLTRKLDLRREADLTLSYCRGHELWNGIEWDCYYYDNYDENDCFSDDEGDCFEDTQTCVV